MLSELRIVDVGVIAEVTLELHGGLNVLTGETGAGKTMVVSSLELLLGGRADADVVRAGARRALVEGRLDPAPAGAQEWLDDPDDDLVVAREVAAQTSTRSRARLSGRSVAVSALAEVVGAAVEVHGQSESARFTGSGVQRELLDRSGGPELAATKEAYAHTYRGWRDAAAELEGLVADARDRARELDRLRFELSEIDVVGPEPGEEERAETELGRLEHAAALAAAAARAADALTADGGARDGLGSAVADLRRVADVDAELDALAERVEQVAAETQDLGIELGGYAQQIAADPVRLDELRDRRGAIAGLARKYGPDAAAIAAYADEARLRAAELDAGDARRQGLGEEVAQREAAVRTAGAALRSARETAGRRLAEEVSRHLEDLAMAGARVVVQLDPTEPGPHGTERVTFLLAANRGEALLPLAKAASGGERSRLALAVRLALADADRTPVLVFDEVDAGIGGATALEVGRKLADLSRGRQVLCVTHLAQLAAFADTHLVVHKAADGARTQATVTALDEPGRVIELSRMLSGSPESELAAGHAAELRQAAIAHVRRG